MSEFIRTQQVSGSPDVTVQVTLSHLGLRVEVFEDEGEPYLLGEFGLTYGEMSDLAIHGRITNWSR